MNNGSHFLSVNMQLYLYIQAVNLHYGDLHVCLNHSSHHLLEN